MQYVTEPEKRVPIAYDVDVAVAGAGVAGVFAALGAARSGASVALIDRFGAVGGNIGPAMIINGAMASGSPHPDAGHIVGIEKGFSGIAQEFIGRHASLGGGGVQPFSRNHYPRDSNVASYTALKMLKESGVQLLLSAYVADPILEDGCVKGLFVETKSGRRAVRATVTVDATGEADVARRAGAPILQPEQTSPDIDWHAPTGMGMGFVVGDADWDAFLAEARKITPSDEEVAWVRENLGEKAVRQYGTLARAARRAWEAGELPDQEIPGLGHARAMFDTSSKIESAREERLVWGILELPRVTALDAGDGLQMAALEARCREIIFEVVRFYRKYAPGLGKAYLMYVAPYLNCRGGPCIEGEYTLTMDDCRAARRFDDVVYRYGEFRAIRYTCEHGGCAWTDVPYRVMVPRQVDGLLAVGRCASGKPDTLLRNRMAVKHMGEAGGRAAALAVEQGVAPRSVDVKELQRRLLSSGFYLGDAERLRELGLPG